MSQTIDQYRAAKATYQKLQNQAKKELIARFHELAAELLQIQRELREDFAHKVVLPTKMKTGARSRLAPVKPIAPSPDPQIPVLEKRLAMEKAKLGKAATAGKSEKVIHDRIYELEDEIRLAKDR